jgi:hypothetical protein
MIASSSGKNITASYELRFADYDAMCRAGEDKLSRWLVRWAFWPLVVFNIVIGIVVLIDRLEANEPLGWPGWFNLLIVAALLTGRFIIVPLLRRYAFKSTRLGGRDYSVTLAEDAVLLEAGDISSRIGVAEIIGASETKTHFFVWFNKRQAAIIPKRAIDEPHDDADVWRYVVANGWKLDRR